MRRGAGIASIMRFGLPRVAFSIRFGERWGLRLIPMEKAFGQRREQIIGDCVQLRTDVEVYNDMNSGKHPAIQLVLDFTDDVAERFAMDEAQRKARRKGPRAEEAA